MMPPAVDRENAYVRTIMVTIILNTMENGDTDIYGGEQELGRSGQHDHEAVVLRSPQLNYN